jgi:hypothetical protein
VGDNIYEYPDLIYPDATQKLRTQVTDPPNEIVSLDDYRRRYRLYRNDPSLQLLGATAPLIMTADDHEYTNNPWMTGAQNHQVGGSNGAGFDGTKYPEGDFYVRITNALQAMYEYNPIREQHSIVYTGASATGSAQADLTAVTGAANNQYRTVINSASDVGYLSGSTQAMPGAPVVNVTALARYRMLTLQRSFDFGTVLTVALTEDRVSYRTSANSELNNGALSPIGPMDCPSGNAGAFYVANDPLCSPVAQAAVALGMANRTATGISLSNPATWTQAQIANLSTTFSSSMMYNPMYYNNASQHIIGTTPVAWLGTTFAASKAANIKFQVWASQTVFMITEASDTYNATVSGRATSQSLNPVMNPFAGPYAAYSLCTVLGAGCAAAWASMPWNVDGWDGFNAERLAVLTALGQANNPIVNSGDAHGFWLGTIKSGLTTGAPSVVEFAGGSITSQGWGECVPVAQVAARLRFANQRAIHSTSQQLFPGAQRGERRAGDGLHAEPGQQRLPQRAGGRLHHRQRAQRHGGQPPSARRAGVQGDHQQLRRPGVHHRHDEQHDVQHHVRLRLLRCTRHSGRDDVAGGGRQPRMRVHRERHERRGWHCARHLQRHDRQERRVPDDCVGAAAGLRHRRSHHRPAHAALVQRRRRALHHRHVGGGLLVPQAADAAHQDQPADVQQPADHQRHVHLAPRRAAGVPGAHDGGVPAGHRRRRRVD